MSFAWLSPDARAELLAEMRAIVHAEAERPEFVSQRTCERWLSIPSRDFLRAARAGAFLVAKTHRRLLLARTVDVVEWIERHRVARDAANDPADDLDAALASVGARRVGGSK